MFLTATLATGLVAIIVLLQIGHRKRVRETRRQAEEERRDQIRTVARAIVATKKGDTPLWTHSHQEIKQRISEAAAVMENKTGNKERLPHHALEVSILVAHAIGGYATTAKKAYDELETHDRSLPRVPDHDGLKRKDYLTRKFKHMQERYLHLHTSAAGLGFYFR